MLDEEEADQADYEVVGEPDHPAGYEVVGGATLAGAGPEHVAHLEDEAVHDPAQGGQQVSHREAEDQTRELTGAKTAKCTMTH